MNFSILQWIFAFVLDVLIKAVIVTYLGLLFMLSGMPIADLAELAIPLSLFHFAYLFLAILLLQLMADFRLELARTGKFLFTLFVGNSLFVASFAALAGFSPRPDAVYEGLSLGVALAITNIPPMLIVAGFGRLFRRS